MKCCTHAAAVIKISTIIVLCESVSQIHQKGFWSGHMTRDFSCCDCKSSNPHNKGVVKSKTFLLL